MVSRRDFLKSMAVCLPLVAFGTYRWRTDPSLRPLAAAPAGVDPLNDPVVYLPSGEFGTKIPIRGRLRPVHRPPGAVDEEEFKRRCIRCHRCGQACPNDTIRFIQDSGSPNGSGTPVITPREQGCIVCLTCSSVCPSGALQPIEEGDYDTVAKQAKMGVAVVDRDACLSYNGEVCGKCTRACPLRGKALWAEVWEQPIVDANACVGCGLCEQVCVQIPQAIRVVPLQETSQ